jgi:GAF domain-containing protein
MTANVVVTKTTVGSKTEGALQEGSATRTSQASVSAALAAANAAARAAISSETRFPGEDGGRSLAELAYRDLDATLQLLADRAQYITGSTGAAIALRRVGKNDMLCRASSGSNAPELGALLSAEFGLSGESVRTRQALRCDDAERDARVNREVCRQMGIASVVVMPVVHDDEVLGVFELFSGKVNAFGERDLSALQRLSEMVETAVKLAHAVQELPERLKSAAPAAETAANEILEEPILDDEPVLEIESEPHVVAAPANIDPLAAVPSEVPVEEESQVELLAEAAHETAPELSIVEPAPSLPVPAVLLEQVAPQFDVPAVASVSPVVPAPAKKPMLWSAAGVNAEATKPTEVDESHVPPVLRNLRKCEACGFPVSAGRALCVECEEKKWRGQIGGPQAASQHSASTAGKLAAAATVRQAKSLRETATLSASAVAPSELAFAAAAQSSPVVGAVVAPAPSLKAVVVSSAPSISPAIPAVNSAERSYEPELVLSAGLAPSQSWFAANKYILGALLVIGAVVAGVFLLR